MLGGLDTGIRVIGLDGQIEEYLGVIEGGLESVEVRDLALEDALVTQQLLGLLPGVPEIRASRFVL